MLVADINPGPGSSHPFYFTPMNARLYFSADDGETGRELWAFGIDTFEQLDDLTDELTALKLDVGIKKSLKSKLNTSLRVLRDANSQNDIAGLNALRAFIHLIEAQRSDKISASDADALIKAAQEIISGLQEPDASLGGQTGSREFR